MCYFSRSCYPIDFKPWHNDPYVLGMRGCDMTLLSHTSCSLGFVQDFLDHYLDQCWHINVHVGRSPCMNLGQSI